MEYALEIDEANPQNMEEALKRYAADHNGQYKLIFIGTSTKKYDIWTSISQMLEKISLKNIKIEISLDNVIFPNNKIPDNLFVANAINKSIVKITFPDTITEIGEYSIYCPELTEITLPSNLITIGNRGLIGCYNLKSLKLPNSLKTIGELALKECGFASIEIPDSVTSIGKTAFGDCENLIDIKLPNNLETISEGMFESCGSLNTITIPASVKTIEGMATAKPFLGTDVAFRGLSVKDAGNCYIENDLDNFPIRIKEILSNLSAAARVGASGADYALEYDYRQIFVPYSDAFM